MAAAKRKAKARQGRKASAPTEQPAYPLHPVCRDYADFTGAEAGEMRESLRALGLLNPIVLWDDQIVDGRHREMFCRELGIEARYDDITDRCPTEQDMRAYVAALNQHRRSRTTPLTVAEKREKVDAALKADPERSDQAIAEECGVSVPFVGKRRKVLSKKGVNVNTDPAKRRSRTGKRGQGQRKKQPRRSPKPKPEPEPEPEPDGDDNAQDDGNGKARSIGRPRKIRRLEDLKTFITEMEQQPGVNPNTNLHVYKIVWMNGEKLLLDEFGFPTFCFFEQEGEDDQSPFLTIDYWGDDELAHNFRHCDRLEGIKHDDGGLGAFWDTATEQDRARFAQSHRTVLLKALDLPLEATEPSPPATAAQMPPPISMFPITAALEIIRMLGDRPKKWKVDVARQMLLLLERESAPTSTQPAEPEAV
jgi:ParB-like chromosome segregation protein Spo0J